MVSENGFLHLERFLLAKKSSTRFLMNHQVFDELSSFCWKIYEFLRGLYRTFMIHQVFDESSSFWWIINSIAFKYCSGAAQKNVFWRCHIIIKRWFGGVFPTYTFIINWDITTQFCFRDNWEILNFVPANYFFIETHWAEQFFSETLVCFQGVAKPSFSDGFATCFSIEFLFPKIDSDIRITHY